MHSAEALDQSVRIKSTSVIPAQAGIQMYATHGSLKSSGRSAKEPSLFRIPSRPYFPANSGDNTVRK